MKTPTRQQITLLIWLVPLAIVLNLSMYRHSAIGQVQYLSDSMPNDVPNGVPATVAQPPLKQRLPMFKDKGGLIVFLHVAKTGGTTIRDDFAEIPNMNVKRVFDRKELDASSGKIDWHLSDKNNNDQANGESPKTMLLEIHGSHGEPMTIFEIHPYLQRWRAAAKANGKEMFVVTLLRDPVSFYVSYFKFFKHPGCNAPWCDLPTMELTEENLLASAVPNHQCQYLARRVHKEENAAVPVSQEECQSVFQLMKADLDWIGSTETMQDTTLPLLSYILTGSSETGRQMKVKNKQKRFKSLSTKSLSEEGRRRLEEISMFDRDLYNSVSKHYSLEMWENYSAISQ